MSINLTLPEMGPFGKTAKDAIITMLGTSWPMTIRKMHLVLQREYGMEISYQGVHQAIHHLEESGMVIKHNEFYELDSKWIERLKKFSEQLYASYSKNQIPNQESAVINLKFTNLSELEQFILWKFTFTFPNPEKKQSIAIWNHVWPGIGLSTTDITQTEEILRDENIYSICRGETNLDKIWGHWLTKLGMKIKLGVRTNSMYDIMVKGDHVLQTYLSEEFLDQINQTYETIESDDAIDIDRMVKLVANKETEINTTIIKNPELADQIRKKVVSHFK